MRRCNDAGGGAVFSLLRSVLRAQCLKLGLLVGKLFSTLGSRRPVVLDRSRQLPDLMSLRLAFCRMRIADLRRSFKQLDNARAQLAKLVGCGECIG
jgi:hypothetical protein